jgi:hypothetical protein
MISIEQYAELCALMTETGGDETKEFAIAEANSVSSAEWKEAKAGFTAKMSDPADMGKTAMAFMPLYQAALDKKRGGGEPCTLEVYSKVHAGMAFRKDPMDSTKKIDYLIVLAENGFTHQSWLECESYWTPRVGVDTDPKFEIAAATKFRELIQKESDIILGIVR